MTDREISVPCDLAAEEAVLGGVMLSPEWLVRLEGELRLAPEHFHSRRNRTVFTAILELASKGKAFDPIVVSEWFAANGASDMVEGGAFLVEIASSTWSAANVQAHAEIVIETWRRRRLADIGQKLTKLALTPGNRSAVQLANEVQHHLAQIAPAHSVGLVPYRQLLGPWFEDLTRRHDDGGLPGIETPWEDLNDVLHGLQDSELIVLAARSNMGKSVMAFQLSRHVGLSQRVAVFSMEMNGNQIVRRDVAAVGQVPHRWLHEPRKDEDSDMRWDRVANAIRDLRDIDVLVDTDPQLSSAQVIARCRRAHLQKPLRMVLIDHLHEMAVQGKQNEAIERGQIARDMKALAKELGCPVVLLAQLNRTAAHSGKAGSGAAARGRPTLDTLRGAGAIEEAADVVLFIHRPDYYDPEDRPGLVEVIVGKGRDVETGKVVNLHNRYDQMRMDPWGDQAVPLPAEERPQVSVIEPYGGSKLKTKPVPHPSGRDAAAGGDT